eukprot:2136465-Amphidinium_carterae.1
MRLELTPCLAEGVRSAYRIVNSQNGKSSQTAKAARISFKCVQTANRPHIVQKSTQDAQWFRVASLLYKNLRNFPGFLQRQTALEPPYEKP